MLHRLGSNCIRDASARLECRAVVHARLIEAKVVTRASEVLFVDPAVDDLGRILSGLRPGIEAVVLDPVRPAARQMAEALEGRADLDAVHMVAHGAPGRVSFAAGEWTCETLVDQADDLAAIGRALGERGDLRLWSCYAGAGSAGSAFVQRLALATGAEVAAAAGLVGAAALGGRWELITRAGGATVSSPLTKMGMAGYPAILVAKTWLTTGTTAWAFAGN